MTEDSSTRTCPHASGAAEAARVRRASKADRADLPLPPGPGGRRLRHLITHFTTYPEFTRKMYREYGDVVLYRMTWLGKCCLLFDPALIRAVLDTEERELIRQQLSVDLARFPHGGMNTRYGEDHNERAAIVRSAFSADRMHSYTGRIADRVRERVDSWRDGQPIDVLQEMLRLCVGVFLDLLVGEDMGPDVDVGMDLRRALKVEYIVEQLPFLRRFRRLPLPFVKRLDRTFEAVDDLIYRAIERSEDPSHEGRDLVSHIVRTRRETDGGGPYPSNEEIRDEIVLVLLSAGPAAHLLTCGIEHLAREPAVCNRLAAEADEVLNGRPVRGFDVDRLPYARATVAEVLRLSSTAWVVWKRAAEDLVVDGYLIPRGTIVHPCFGVVHQRPEYYERGEEFRPERWLDQPRPDSGSGPPPYHPFSYGFRECPGGGFANVTGAFLLAEIARQWELERVSRRRQRPFALRPLGGPMRVRGSLRLRPRARNAASYTG